MVDKWRNGEFQTCQRAYCNMQQMLPIGVTDKPLVECVKLYCPQCNEIYTPIKQRYQSLDGAYFGTGFPHMLFMVYPQLRIKPHKDQFVPKMYGFKIHDTALDVQLQKGKEIENQRKRTTLALEEHPRSEPGRAGGVDDHERGRGYYSGWEYDECHRVPSQRVRGTRAYAAAGDTCWC